MKRFVLLAVAALISSCADKRDPGLDQPPPPPPAKSSAVDPLKGKSPAEVLKLKYSHAVAICSLLRSTINVSDGNPDMTDTRFQESSMVEMDLAAWAEESPAFKPATFTLTNTVAGKQLSVILSVEKFSIIDLSEKVKNLVYLASYSPQVDFTYTVAIDSGAPSPHITSGLILEGFSNSSKIITITTGEGATAKNHTFELSCGTETTANKEFESQFETIDCAAPKEGQKELAAKSCKD